MNVTICSRANLQELDGEKPAGLWTEGSTSTLPLRFARGEAQSDINGNEVVTSTARFYPYGEYRVTPSAGRTDKGFTGHAQNDEVALIYMRARYYVPGVGRFASADTVVPNETEPQDLNRYSYVRNAPLQLIDPTGHTCANPSNPNEEAACYTAEHNILERTVIIKFYGVKYVQREVGGGRIIIDRVTPANAATTWMGLGTMMDSNTIYTNDHCYPAELADVTSVQVYDAKGRLVYSGGWTDYRTEGRAGLLILDRWRGIDGPATKLGHLDSLEPGTELAQVVLQGGETPYVQWVEFDRRWLDEPMFVRQAGRVCGSDCRGDSVSVEPRLRFFNSKSLDWNQKVWRQYLKQSICQDSTVYKSV